jgi:putative redox protein
MAEKTLTIKSESKAGIRVETSVRDFEFVTDQPEEKNGTNKGPTPVEYLLGSLGSCICITCRMIADRMGMKIDSVKTEVEGDIDYEGMVNPDEVRPGVGEIRMKVDLNGDLYEEGKQKIVERAEQSCPVTDTLKNQVNIRFGLSNEK